MQIRALITILIRNILANGEHVADDGVFVIVRVVFGCEVELVDEPAALHLQDQHDQHEFGEVASEAALLAASAHQQPPPCLQNRLALYQSQYLHVLQHSRKVGKKNCTNSHHHEAQSQPLVLCHLARSHIQTYCSQSRIQLLQL
jgi:hypothetical protein